MRTLLLATTFVLISFTAFFSTDLFAGQPNESAKKKYASDSSAPYKSFAGIIAAAQKKASDIKSGGNEVTKASKFSHARTKNSKKIAASKNRSSLKSLSKKSRLAKSLSATKKTHLKKLSIRKSKLADRSLKKTKYTRNYSAKSKSLKDRTNRKTTGLSKTSAAR
jgi:hypothetical protein